MVGVGRTLSIQDELFEIVRTLRVKPGGVLTSEHITELKELWHAEKAFKQADQYFFVNEIKTIEPIEDEQQDGNTGEASADSTENTAGGQMDLGGGDGDQKEHN
jgi:hypothetical protein